MVEKRSMAFKKQETPIIKIKKKREQLPITELLAKKQRSDAKLIEQQKLRSIKEEIILENFRCNEQEPIIIDSSSDDEEMTKNHFKIKIPITQSTSMTTSNTQITVKFDKEDDLKKKTLPLKSTSSTVKLPKRKRKIVPPPDFKILRFTEHDQVAVDGFQYTCPEIECHFLSHFHGDHYCGISKSWFSYQPHSKIYCSKITRDLMLFKFNIYEPELIDRIVTLPLSEYVYLNSNLRVICHDANHCPGAVVMEFEYGVKSLKTLKKEEEQDDCSDADFNIGLRYLHTGDFRFDMDTMPELLTHKYDKVYLDTTYLDYRYKFPNKTRLIDNLRFFVNEQVIKKFKTNNYQKQKTLEYFFFKKTTNGAQNNLKICILIGAYNIGKEDLIIGLCESFNNCKLVIDEKTLRSRIDFKYENFEQTNNFPKTILQEFSSGAEIVVCIVPTSDLSSKTPKELKEKYCSKVNQHFSNLQIVAIVPSGWNYISRWSNGYESDVDTLAKYDPSNCHSILEGYMDEETVFDINTLVNVSNQRMVKFDTKYNIVTIKIPYSDHSSFTNLCEFGIYTDWQEIIPTVNMHKGSAYFDYWFKLWKMNNKKTIIDAN